MSEASRPSLLAGSGLWPRFSEYEVVTSGHSVYVVPRPNAKLEFYRPFDLYPQLLVDFIKMAKGLSDLNENPFAHLAISVQVRDTAWRSRLIKKAHEAVLPFVRQYGLMGLLSDFVEFEVWDDEKKEMMLTLTPEWWGPTQMTFSEYARFFYPRGQVPKYQQDWFAEEVLRGQGERIDLIAVSITKLLRDYEVWNQFTTSQPHPEEEWRGNITWKARLEAISVPTRVGVVFRDGKLELDWHFRSLLEAVRIMFVENMTRTDKPVRLCPVCGVPFVPARSDSPGCPMHGAAIRKRRERKNRAVAIQMFQQGAPFEEIVKRFERGVDRSTEADVEAAKKYVANWLYESGEAVSDIAVKVGVDEGTVRGWLKVRAHREGEHE